MASPAPTDRDIRVTDPLTDHEFTQLTGGDVIDVFLPDYGATARCLVASVSGDAPVVLVDGEHRNQTIKRRVHRQLIWSKSA